MKSFKINGFGHIDFDKDKRKATLGGNRYTDVDNIYEVSVTVDMPMYAEEFFVVNPKQIGTSGTYPVTCTTYDDEDGKRMECRIHTLDRLKDWFRDNDPYVRELEYKLGMQPDSGTAMLHMLKSAIKEAKKGREPVIDVPGLQVVRATDMPETEQVEEMERLRENLRKEADKHWTALQEEPRSED